MLTKTDRILSYLPGTFRANLPVTGLQSALYAYANTFGGELQQAENKLAEIMQSHWVDTADRNAELIQDLAQIAALYGLAPRDDEEVEEFRQHLKRYVRTFLEGTVTVQGILRVAAEALGLTIADRYEDLDTWWKHDKEELVSVTPDGSDAAGLVLGLPFARVEGHPATPVRLEGIVDLRTEVNLRGASILRLQVNDLATQTIELVGPGEDARHVTLDMIVSKINQVFQGLLKKDVAFQHNHHLLIQSPTTGPSSRLEFEEGDQDASTLVLGLRPLAYFGTSAAPASLVGTVDLSGDLDLRATRYLRLVIDGSHAAEVDCGGATPGHRTVEEVRDAINTALGITVATIVENEGKKFLALTSTTSGNASSIAIQSAASQDAADRLLGPQAPVYLGHDDTSATVTSPDLAREVDLSLRYNLRISLDDAVALTINCAGLSPASTTLEEICNAINAALEADIARRVGQHILLTSTTTGPGSQIRFETPDEADATELIFGLPPRTRRGAAPTSARMVGKAEIDEVNLMARHFLRVRVDGNPPVTVDLHDGVTRHGFDPSRAILADLVESVRSALGPDTASDDGLHLILSSPTIGGGSGVEVLPLEVEQRQHFVTRAVITGEATHALFGFDWKTSLGTDAVNARLKGTVDLSHGVDLRAAHYLRMGLDGRDPVEIDCAGPRPRATLLEEIVGKINDTLRAKYPLDEDVAFSDGRHLVLASPTAGSSSQIRFEPPRAQDALDLLLGWPPSTVLGTNAGGVTLVGIPDLADGIDLPAHSALKIGLDGASAVEVPLTSETPAHVSLSDIVVAISLQLGSGVASHDGHHLLMASQKSGVAAQLSFETPAGTDSTSTLFGFTAPRTYQGMDARPAELLGNVDLSADKDLRIVRFLRIGLDGNAPVDIDCAKAATAALPTTPGEEPPFDPAAQIKLQHILDSINAVLKVDVASAEGNLLKLTSPTMGTSSRITLEHYTGGDARTALLGNVNDVTNGTEPQLASVSSVESLVQPFDFSQRSLLRIAVNGGRSRIIDVHGVAPATTFLDEVVAKIEDIFPGLASVTDDDRLVLTAPSSGGKSSVSVLPIRTIDLLEYPPETVEMPSVKVRHGSSFAVMNSGADEADAVLIFSAPSGTSGATLFNQATSWRIQLLSSLQAGETARIWVESDHLHASLTSKDGQSRPISPDQIVSTPMGSRAPVPFVGDWLLNGSGTGAAYLLLDNSLEQNLVELRSLRSGQNQPKINVSVVEASLIQQPSPPGDGSVVSMIGRVRENASGLWLEGPDGHVVSQLRNGIQGGLDAYRDSVVVVKGPMFAPAVEGDPYLLIVESVDRLFDVTIQIITKEGKPILESYVSVTIGGDIDEDSLVSKINGGQNPSQWIRARLLEKANVLRLPRGRSLWRYLDCTSDRFDDAVFDQAHFAGGICIERGIFDVSRFNNSPPEDIQTVFTSLPPLTDPEVKVAMTWMEHRRGAFEVHLPADLPEKFGGRFDQGRFGRSSNQPELYERLVTEPATDDNHIVKRLNSRSELVRAKIVAGVPLGWTPNAIPFRKPRFLTLGSEETPARIYFSEEGIDGFIEIHARTEGDWGNGISVSARKAGPALFDVTVAYDGAVFELARKIASGPDLPDLVLDVLQPAPVGILLAKAAGIRVSVKREGTIE